jgi:hypothetical protein
VSESAGHNHRHPGLTWLAILALLIDALLPTAISAAADAPASATSIYCGSTPGKHGPTKQSPATPHHCALCLAITTALAPGHLMAVPAPRFAEIAVAGFANSEAAPAPIAYAAPQPRGPPVAV